MWVRPPPSAFMVIVAQLAEQRIVVPRVAGSSPVSHPYNKEKVMAKQKINESWNVQYYSRDAQSNEDILNLNMSWENRDIDGVKKNLNIWLSAIGIPLQVTDKK